MRLEAVGMTMKTSFVKLREQTASRHYETMAPPRFRGYSRRLCNSSGRSTSDDAHRA